MANSFSKEGQNVLTGPEEKWRRRKVFNLSRSKLPIIIITLLMLYVSFSLVSRFDQLFAMQRDLKAIQDEVKELRGKNAGLQQQIERLRSDAYVEQVAREKLGLVKPGEARIVPVAPGAGNSPQQTPDSELKD